MAVIDLLSLVLIVLYDLLFFVVIKTVVNSLIKKIGLMVGHFILVTLLGIIYFRFFANPETLAEPPLLVCLYMAIGPLFFLMCKEYYSKIAQFTNHENVSLNNDGREQLLILFFGITFLVQLLVLFSV